MWKINRYIITIYCIFFFINTRCGIQDDREISILALFYLNFEREEFNKRVLTTYEPNNSIEEAFCIDEPNKNYLLFPNEFPRAIHSAIFPCEDIDYFEINFLNKRFSLDYNIEETDTIFILVEDKNGIIFDSREPDAVNPWIHFNHTNNLVYLDYNFKHRRLIFRDIDYAYIKIFRNDKVECEENSDGYYYFIKVKNDVPLESDFLDNRGFFRLTGEFLPCPP